MNRLQLAVAESADGGSAHPGGMHAAIQSAKCGPWSQLAMRNNGNLVTPEALIPPAWQQFLIGVLKLILKHVGNAIRCQMLINGQGPHRVTPALRQLETPC